MGFEPRCKLNSGLRGEHERTESGKSKAERAAEIVTVQKRELLNALQAVRNGDFSVRLPGDSEGIDGKIADTFNENRRRERPDGG